MKRKLITISLFVVLVGIFVLYLYNDSLKKKIIINEQTQEQQIQQIQQKEQQKEDVAQEIELQRKILEDKIKAVRFNLSVSNQVELILAKEHGSLTVSHDKTPEDEWWNEWLISSEIEVSIEYNIIIAIPTIYIHADVEGTELIITYDYTKVDIDSVEITNIVPVESKNLFGEAYAPEDIAALTLIARSKVFEDASTDSELFAQAEKNLINEIANKSMELFGKCVKIERIGFNEIAG